MAQTATSLASVIKDVWTSDRIQKQFEAANAPLSRLQSVQGTMIGTQAQVPIYNNRSGAYTSVGAAGGSLNPALAQQVTQATYTLVYSWFQTELETSALAQAGGGMQSVISAKDLEIQGGLENTLHQMTRQLVTNGDGIVASCATSVIFFWCGSYSTDRPDRFRHSSACSTRWYSVCVSRSTGPAGRSTSSAR